MKSAKQKITPRKTTKKTTTISPPAVNIQPPIVNFDAPNIPTDNLEAILNGLVVHQQQIAAQLVSLIKEQDVRMNKIMDENNRILAQLAKRKPNTRPDDFYVEFEKNGDETVGMRIRGLKSH